LIEFDPDKDAINRAKHRLSLTLAEGFEWDTALIEEDTRYDYDEQRFRAFGYIGQRLYVMIYCLRDNDITRVISLRPAEPKEYRYYANA